MNTDNMHIKDPVIRENILKFKMYRIFSYIFFAVGGLTFLMLYSSYLGGRSFKDVFSFALVVIVVLPFVPALVLSMIALRTEKATEKALALYIEQEQRKKVEKDRLADQRMAEAEAARMKAKAKEEEEEEQECLASMQQEPAILAAEVSSEDK
jgi:signal transduction histidine kinase